MHSSILFAPLSLNAGDLSQFLLSATVANLLLGSSPWPEAAEEEQKLRQLHTSPSGHEVRILEEQCTVSEPSVVSYPPSSVSETISETTDSESDEMAEQSSLQEDEKKLKAITVQYMYSKEINPFQGSVPVEKVQNLLRNQHMELYTTVVGTKHRAWNKFVERHADTFELLTPEEGKWRMRLLVHEDYRAGDEKERAARVAQDAHLLKALTEYLLSTPDMTSTVDEFITAYPELPCNITGSDDQRENPLPKRGDLVRFIKRKTQAFGYDSANYVVRLLPSYMVEVLLNVGY